MRVHIRNRAGESPSRHFLLRPQRPPELGPFLCTVAGELEAERDRQLRSLERGPWRVLNVKYTMRELYNFRDNVGPVPDKLRRKYRVQNYSVNGGWTEAA
jgi:hypothetical protein